LRDPEIGIAVLNKSESQIKFSSKWANELFIDKIRINNSKNSAVFSFKLKNLVEYDLYKLCNCFFEIFIIDTIKLYNYKLELINTFKKTEILQNERYYFDFKNKIVFKRYQDYLFSNKRYLRLLIFKIIGTDLCYNKNSIFKTHINDNFIEYKIIFLYKVAHFLKLDKLLPSSIRNFIKSILSYVKDNKIDAIHRL